MQKREIALVEETLRPRRTAEEIADLEADAVDIAAAAQAHAERLLDREGRAGRKLREGRESPGIPVAGRIDPRRAAILKAIGIPLVDVIERGVDAAGMVLIGATDAEIGAYFRECKPLVSKKTGRGLGCDNNEHHHPERSIKAADMDFDGALALLRAILNRKCKSARNKPCKKCSSPGKNVLDARKAS